MINIDKYDLYAAKHQNEAENEAENDAEKEDTTVQMSTNKY